MINYCPNKIFNEEFQKLLTTNITTNTLKKCYIQLYIDWVRKTERPFQLTNNLILALKVKD